MRSWMMLTCMAVAMLATGHASAAATVQVVGTWPAGDTLTLARNQNFFLHLRYHSDAPTHIWARPYFEGKPANAGSNPSRTYPAGSGEALGWFFLAEPGTRVDEVRISAGDGSNNGTHVIATYPVALTASDEPAPAASPPTWVTTLRAADKAAHDADYQKAMNTPPSAGESLFFGGFMLAMLALGLLGFVAPAWALRRWRGGWRMAAMVPLAVMAFVVLRLVFGVMIDPTSHNLWPFEIVMAGLLSGAIMLVLVVARKIVGPTRT